MLCTELHYNIKKPKTSILLNFLKTHLLFNTKNSYCYNMMYISVFENTFCPLCVIRILIT